MEMHSVIIKPYKLFRSKCLSLIYLPIKNNKNIMDKKNEMYPTLAKIYGSSFFIKQK